MVSIEKLSKIGLGTYRMSINDDLHFKCLKYSIDNGINLIDTASNYLSGNSERLIGKYLSNANRRNMFVVTKAGYIQGGDLQTYSSVISGAHSTKIGKHSFYSFEKSFLEKQIFASLKRLNTDYLDGFLIHNPEYNLLNPTFTEYKFYEQLNESLFFLEELTKKGVIRYYGISSNKLPTQEINLNKIFQNIEKLPRFKLLQFPYNLVENEASTKEINNQPLLSICQDRGIKTFANRPLNTIYKKNVVRLADYSNEFQKTDIMEEKKMFDEFLELVSKRLFELGETSKPAAFTPISFFIENRKNIANPEAVTKAIRGYLHPFINKLQFDQEVGVMKIIHELSSFWILFSKKLITERAIELKSELVGNGLIPRTDNRDLSLIACEKYLNDGIDHVLVGMRKTEYVDRLKSLF